MKTIDEIIDQYTPYSKNISTWDREDIHSMMREYATQVIDIFMDDIRGVVKTEVNLSDIGLGKVLVINADKVIKLKQELE